MSPFFEISLDGLEDLRDQLRHDPEGRLVEHQEPRLRHQPPTDRQLLLLAAGERLGPLPLALRQPREEGENRFERLLRPLFRIDGVRPHEQVVDHGESTEELAPLRHHGDPPPHDVVRRDGVEGLAVQEDLPGPEPQEPRDRPQDGALPRPVGADEAHHLALFHGEGDVLDREDPALVPDGGVPDFKHGSDPPGRPG